MTKQTKFKFSVHCFDMDTETQKKGNKIIDKNKFNEQVKIKNSDLQKAKGVYVFALKHGQNYTPYYIGQTTKSGLLQESLNPGNLKKYDKCLGECVNMKPVMIYIVYLTPKNAVSKKQHPKAKDLYNWLEAYMIMLGVQKNQKLVNGKKVKYLNSVVVPGLLNSPQGKPSDPATILRKTLL